eukprot:4261772-Prymnesium_polylepis.1
MRRGEARVGVGRHVACAWGWWAAGGLRVGVAVVVRGVPLTAERLHPAEDVLDLGVPREADAVVVVEGAEAA